MYRINTKRLYGWHQERHQNDHQGSALNQRTEHEQDHVDCQQKRIGIAGERGDQLHQRLSGLLKREHPGKC
ncbi:hypothetical protein D3C80_500700 [compost metagenome]